MPLGGFEMQTAGAMVCDSHHVPSTGLEALVVVSKYGIIRLADLAPVRLFLAPISDVLTICIRWKARYDPSQHRDQFEVSATGT